MTDEVRLSIRVDDLLEVATGNETWENMMNRALRRLADDLNCVLSYYEVRLVHLDTMDYLEFIPQPIPDEEIPF